MVTTRSRGQSSKKPRKKATDKRPVKAKVEFLLDQELIVPFNKALTEVRVCEERRERLRASPVPAETNTEVWRSQLNLAELELAAARETLEAAKAAVDAEVLVVELQAISSKRYFDLLAEHPPTPEQIESADEEADKAGIWEGLTVAQRKASQISFNPDTLPRALVAECDVTKLDDEELDLIFDTEGPYTLEDRSELFNQALALCQRASILRR